MLLTCFYLQCTKYDRILLTVLWLGILAFRKITLQRYKTVSPIKLHAWFSQICCSRNIPGQNALNNLLCGRSVNKVVICSETVWSTLRVQLHQMLTKFLQMHFHQQTSRSVCTNNKMLCCCRESVMHQTRTGIATRTKVWTLIRTTSATRTAIRTPTRTITGAPRLGIFR